MLTSSSLCPYLQPQIQTFISVSSFIHENDKQKIKKKWPLRGVPLPAPPQRLEFFQQYKIFTLPLEHYGSPLGEPIPQNMSKWGLLSFPPPPSDHTCNHKYKPSFQLAHSYMKMTSKKLKKNGLRGGCRCRHLLRGWNSFNSIRYSPYLLSIMAAH